MEWKKEATSPKPEQRFRRGKKSGIAYVLIGPRGGGALCGHAHAGAFLAAAPVVALEVIESQFAAVAVLPLDVLLRRKRDTKFMSALRKEAKRHGAMLLQC